MKGLRTWLLALLGAALLGLAGCGPKESGTKVTVRLTSPVGGTPATATVVYQVGDGSWALAAQEDYGVYTFVVPPGETRYGVAVNCLPPLTFLGSIGFANVYQLTTDDTTEIQTSCFNLSDLSLAEFRVTPKKDPADPGSYDRAWIHTDFNEDTTSLGSSTDLLAVAGADRDLLAIAYDGSYDPAQIKRIVLLRDVNVEVGASVEVTFTAADEPQTQSVGSFTVPADATASYFGIGFVSKKGVAVPSSDSGFDQPQLGSGDRTGGSYAVVPGTTDGDLYFAEATAEKPSGSYMYRLGQIKLFGPDPQDPGFDLPQNWFDPAVQEETYPVFGNLAYTGSNLQGYAFFVSLGGFLEMIYVSKDWLGDATSYTVPDLSEAPDFRGSEPLPGDQIAWSAVAVMANRSFGEFVSARPLPLSWNPVPAIPGLAVQTASKSGQYVAP